ncbi:MAG: D-aminoacyl-tRNA deacylase [Thermogutta sp.]
MRACIQRVRWARVRVAGNVVGEIGKGLLVLLGVSVRDEDSEAVLLAQKTADLRIFEGHEGKMNLGLADVGGAVLVVSQFTLLADCRKGRRPSFTAAASPERAERLYRVYVDALRGLGLPTAEGRFRQHMELELLNDGPVTILLDSEELRRPRRGSSGAGCDES